MNWTPANIFDVRDRKVRARDGTTHVVKLYADGWAIAGHEGLDVWTACRKRTTPIPRSRRAA